MCSARLCPLPVLSPNVQRSFKLGCHEAQHRRKRGLFYLQHPAWGAHVTQLDCKSQLSGSLATLANDGQIRLAERVMPNQGILMFRQRSQTLAFRCRQHPTTRHGCLSTLVSDSLPYPAAVTNKILTFVFLNITLESFFFFQAEDGIRDPRVQSDAQAYVRGAQRNPVAPAAHSTRRQAAARTDCADARNTAPQQAMLRLGSCRESVPVNRT